MTTIAILARDSVGVALAGLTPTWVNYFNAATGAAATQPAISAVGGGSYKFTIEDLATNPAPMGIIDLGGASVPRYQVFALDSAYVGFAAWDQDGAPLAGLVPTWNHLKRVSDNADVAQPAITALGGGLYKTTRVADHSTGAIDLGATAYPRTFHYDNEAIAGLGGGAAPTLAVVSPTPSTPAGDPGGFDADPATAEQTPIVLDIDSTDTVAYANVVCRFPGRADELAVFARAPGVADSFRGDFAARSWSEVIGSKLRLHVLPSAGWPNSGSLLDITFDVDAVGGDGSNVSTTRS